MAEIVKKKLDFWKWIQKINEKTTFLIMRVYDYKDMTEDDRSLLKALHRTFDYGEYDIYESIPVMSEEVAKNISLFDSLSKEEGDRITDINKVIDDGMNIEPLPIDIKIKDNE